MGPEEVGRVVLVMGATGSGKSSLVRLATGNPNVEVGESLRSGQSFICSSGLKGVPLHRRYLQRPARWRRIRLTTGVYHSH